MKRIQVKAVSPPGETAIQYFLNVDLISAVYSEGLEKNWPVTVIVCAGDHYRTHATPVEIFRAIDKA